MADLFQVTVDSRQLDLALTTLSASITDMSPLMAGVAAELQNQVEANFAAQGRPNWAALAEETKANRPDPDGPILQVSGQLAASVQVESGAIFASIGTNKVYGAIHQFGGQAGRGLATSIPARPYIPISEDGQLQPETERAIVGMLYAYLGKSVTNGV